MKKNEVFVFKGNKTTTRAAHNSKASSVQVPKKTSTVPKPILKSKENVEENDQEMKSLNSTFDKDDEEKIDDKTTKENLNSTFEKVKITSILSDFSLNSEPFNFLFLYRKLTMKKK